MDTGTKFESDIAGLKTDVTGLKADLTALENTILKWFMATAVTLTGMAFAAGRLIH